MTRKTKVFIAHSSLDKDFVDELAMNLKRNNIDVWYDKWSMRIGDSLRTKISEGILGSNYLIVVLSPNSASSKWVSEELNAAFAISMESQSVFILPVLLKGKTSILPLFLRD
ncbi:MAG: molecular chaperone Tir, partial [Flavobacteriales bacterium]